MASLDQAAGRLSEAGIECSEALLPANGFRASAHERLLMGDREAAAEIGQGLPLAVRVVP